MGLMDIYTPSYLNVNYVSAHDLWDKPLGIVRTDVVEPNPDERKVALYLEGVSIPLLLNRTNAKILGEAFGDDYNSWAGKTIRMTKRVVQYRDADVDSIRVSSA